MKIRLWIALLLLSIAIPAIKAQDVAIKTNLISDATLSPNLGIEFALAPKWTMDISGEGNFWKLSHGKRWKHWLLQPEARYWFCDRFQGGFLGLHALGGQYNFGGIKGMPDFLGTKFSELENYRFQGWYAGAGVAFGWAWAIAKHWNIEAEIGLGWVYTRYDKYECAVCGDKLDENHPHNYVGPTKAAVNVVYVF